MSVLGSGVAALAGWRLWGLLALIGAIAIGAAYLVGRSHGAAAEAEEWHEAAVEAAAELATRTAAANDKLRSSRTMSDAAIAGQRKELDDATTEIPDRPLGDRQRGRACLELRRQARAAGAPDPAC